MIVEVTHDGKGMARVERLDERKSAHSLSIALFLFCLARVTRTLDGGGAGVGGERLGGGRVLLSLSIPSFLSISLLPGVLDGGDSVMLRMVEVAQWCEGEARLCWMITEKQYLARGLVTGEPYLCPLLSFSFASLA